MTDEPSEPRPWWRPDVPWWAWPFVVVGVATAAVLLPIVGVIGAATNPTGTWSRLMAMALIGAVALPFFGHWGWAVVAFLAAIVAGVLSYRYEDRGESD